LQRLVDDLLDLARLQNTDFLMDFQELRLCDIVNDVVRSAKQMAILKNIEIQKVQDQQPCIIQGDYGRLRQMFMIILDNAIKFSSENGIVSVSLKDKTVTIRDYGMGISKEDLPYIFDRFYKVKPEENKIGTGLGLAIVKQIAQRHNVEVFVESEQAEGTEFRLEF
ncbi:MAG: HAMP domain-containing sensor histidine kinase, partial [Eubacteriales bacterium]|nr:HAMP domain-containing sensor histidine kinase [Eubacteriales bacterium]